MRHQVLFIQGGGSEGTHDQWDNQLVESLRRELGPDYDLRYPRMPREAEPNYARWKAAIEQELGRLGPGAFLVGHSIGGTILIQVLAEAPHSTLSGVFLLAAPFVGEGGWPSDEMKPMAGLGGKLPPETPIYIYHGSQDETAPPEHADLYGRAIPRAIVRRLGGRDHQLGNDLSEVAADIRGLVGAASSKPD